MTVDTTGLPTYKVTFAVTMSAEDAARYFFENNGDRVINLVHYNQVWDVTVEELYQVFKARLLAELNR
jgi:hypothetical protein